MSAATSLYATFQQLSLSFGICVAAAALELGTRPSDAYAGFMIAFLLVSAISAGATILNRRFAADTGL
jgi:hypothetical protein